MRRLAAVLAALVVLAPPAEAHKTTSRVHEYRHIARDVWGATRCDTGFWTTPVHREPGLGERYDAAGVFYSTEPAGRPWTNCAIAVDDRPWSSEYLCRIIVHEFGHAAGHEHVADPNHIMYAGPLPRFRPCIPRRSR